MSANCEYYQELISRMLDGDLPDTETAALREHVRSCPECRALFLAFSGMTLSLREDEAEPPFSLADSVMSRIHDYEAEKHLAEPDISSVQEPIPLRRSAHTGHPRKKTPAFRSALVAACLVVVIGVGALATFAGRGGSATEAAEAPAAAFSRTTADTTAQEAAAGDMETEMEAAAPMVLAEEAPAAPMAEPQEAPREEAAEDNGALVSGHSLSAPAFIPKGSEAAFDGLISEGGAYPELDYQPFFYVEHNGVIYEFLTDENGEHLLWRDAAEGFPHLSQGSYDDLWAIFK